MDIKINISSKNHQSKVLDHCVAINRLKKITRKRKWGFEVLLRFDLNTTYAIIAYLD